MNTKLHFKFARGTVQPANDLRVLLVAYPLLTVSGESAGGAEQVLWTLERELNALGVSTAVAASEGSRVSGELFSTGLPCSLSDDYERRDREHQQATLHFIDQQSRAGRPFDLIHDMSASFWERAAHVNSPVLATLHLPRHYYRPEQFSRVAPNVSFSFVSNSQLESFGDLPHAAGAVPNGISVSEFAPIEGPRKGLLWLGRICEEKGPHLAIEVATKAAMPLTLAGQVYPFSYHQQYFERQIAPRLDTEAGARFVELPSIEEKRRLLGSAEALLITSLVDETSSLVAMEAAASGTPVIALRRGALPEVVQEGVTGFLVDDVQGALKALQHIEQIDSGTCRKYAQENFCSRRMAIEYLKAYRQVLRKRPELPLAATVA